MALSADTLLRMTPSQRGGLLIAILAVIVGLNWYLFFNPRSTELDGLKAERAKVSKELADVRRIGAEIPILEKEIQTLNEEFGKAQLILPGKKEIPSLLTSVSNLGRESKLEFLVFKPQPELLRDFYALVPVEIAVEGNFHDTAVFFDRVSKLPRIVSITNISMKGTPSNGKISVKTTGLISTFRFLTEEESKKIAEAKKKKEELEKQRRAAPRAR